MWAQSGRWVPTTALKSVDLPLPVAPKKPMMVCSVEARGGGSGVRGASEGFEHHGFGEAVAAVVQRVVEARDGPCEG